MNRTLTETERSLVVRALLMAVETFEKYQTITPELAHQWELQASQAQEMADTFERSAEIILVDCDRS